MTNKLNELVGTSWKGTAELWLDPAGNEVVTSGCSVTIGDGVVGYAWSYEGKPHTGSFTLHDRGADFTDSWHSPQVMKCSTIAGARGLLAVIGSYSAGGSEWGWRTTLSMRPSDELVLQMTNITPWGEYGRAVRMICKRA